MHHFGEIVDGKMQLSEIGNIVNLEWLKTFEMRPDMNLYMDEYIIMPNHFHCIVFIGDNQYNTKINDAQSYKNQFGPQRKNLSSIIRGFKIGVTSNARLIMPEFAWQSRFYDKIIRNNKGLENVRNYIFNNPMNWQDDELNKKEQ
jgi:REP element-mobilizing transposase RayT